MPDMTVEEAASVLSQVVHNLRAAKRLESALKVAVGLDQVVKETELRRMKFSDELQKLNSRLETITGEIEREEVRRESSLAETGRLKTEAQADLQRVNSEVEAEITVAKNSSYRRIKELEEAFKVRVLDLDISIQDKEQRLSHVTDKLEAAKAELTSIKERLG